ncbi:MAG: type II toxin-antitoxin system RelE/ParE family toxin [Caulobacterales bacterium]|nr:type II toxin-antitoxin system RelE/ParE family toxin [Caulobacterales bacterium]
MSVYKTKAFSRFARKARLEDEALLEAARAVMSGHWDADLGGGVFKQRVARAGAGKSGEFRTLLAFCTGGSGFFVYGFAKSARANVTKKELEVVQATAAVLLNHCAGDLARAVAQGELVELELEINDDECPKARVRYPRRDA